MQFCSLYSGSSGNCLYVASENTKILIDAGLSGKRIESALKDRDINPNEIKGIVVTHEHSDHTKGVGILSRRFNIPIFANTNTWKAMYPSLGKISDENIKVFGSYKSFEIGDIVVNPFPIPHDAVEPCGYSFIKGNKKITIATDIGYVTDAIRWNMKDSDLMLLESNHDVDMLKVGPYPYELKRRVLSDRGHLSNENAGKAILEVLSSKIKNILLGHLSDTNNYPCLAHETVTSVLKMEGVNPGKDFTLDVATRDEPTKIYCI
ncbi:MBL fold metallo-hydrolase [Clostridium cylindrosporum]|uniref:Putative metallo-hydrolase YycJ n=1 Tax=Clostridium cylindrosporum DSM 605 TaxID=1121307 RepID=A0A0J8D7L0_CLOCY|nr:MBL fold metallo-hydrolase [Clostridium cylindrosporum]KMT21877.1 putative metallo-hydrolase YycJ [Clostridium cylindrosporum DSM 605]